MSFWRDLACMMGVHGDERNLNITLQVEAGVLKDPGGVVAVEVTIVRTVLSCAHCKARVFSEQTPVKIRMPLIPGGAHAEADAVH